MKLKAFALAFLVSSTAAIAQQPTSQDGSSPAPTLQTVTPEAAFAGCQQHQHLVGTGPLSSRHTEYDTGWEHCIQIENYVSAARTREQDKRAQEAAQARTALPDVVTTKAIADKINSGEIK